MQKLSALLAEKGFFFSPTFDGSYQRDGSKWYRGVEIDNAGTPLYVARFGDWRTDEVHEWRSAEPACQEEHDRILEALAGFRKEEREEKRKVQEEVAAQAQVKWREAIDRGSTPYMERKKIPRLLGAKIDPERTDRLLVPARDVQGKIWGYQRILSEKIQVGEDWVDKFFLKGMRIDGCFHLMGSLPDESVPEATILVCEGYATGASLHLATGLPVCAAFNAGNLESVCIELRSTYPGARLVVCGDDDRWTKRRDGTPWNPGREKATHAARAVGGDTCYPRFNSLDGRPTDWNDLHCREGLDVLKAQIEDALQGKGQSPHRDAPPTPEQEEPAGQGSGGASTDSAANGGPEGFVMPLGYAGQDYFYTSSSNPQISVLRDHSETDLYKLMPRDFWIEEYGYKVTKNAGKKNQYEATEINWAEVKSQLMAECRAQGFFENKRIRGPGVWIDQGKVVVHLGDRLYYDGRTHGLRDLGSEFIYEYARRIQPIHSEPLKLSEMQPLLDILSSLNYARREQMMFLGGWLGVSGICGALPWRPHVWVTGEQGSGKSTVLDFVVKPVTSAFYQLHLQGATTEAGLRQSIKSAAIPVIFDEFESNTERAAQRIDQIVELFRQASSEGGGVIAKGSASGEATEYHARFAGLVSSIGTKLSNGADRARFTLVELKKIHANPEQWSQLEGKLSALTPEYCARLFARLVSQVGNVRENIRELQKRLAQKHSARFGQQYGALLAGWAALTHDEPLTGDQAQALVDQVALDQELSSNQEPDHEECLHHLLNKQIRLDNSPISIEQLLQENRAPSLDWDALKNGAGADNAAWKSLRPKLASLGIYPTHHQGHGPGFLVVGTHPQLAEVFKGTRWASNWAQALGRLPGSIKSFQVRYANKKTPRGTWIPASWFVGEQEPISQDF